MPENRIRELRQKKGMTQKQLAEAARTSQQQIQRIETGIQTARFDLAARICAALGAPIPEVFPSAEMPLARARKRNGLESVYTNDKAADELEKAGFDMDPAIWTFKYRLRGGAEGLLKVSGREKQRLWSLVQEEHSEGFAVFDSEDRRYALNLDHLMFCHFLFDPPYESLMREEEDPSFEVHFYLSDSAEPLTFSVDPDMASIEDESASGEAVQLQDLFYYAELGGERRLKFTDEDGETAFFQARDVSMFSVPLAAVEPKLFDSFLEDDEEEGLQT